MDVVNNFPTLCFSDLVPHNKLSQNIMAWAAMMDHPLQFCGLPRQVCSSSWSSLQSVGGSAWLAGVPSSCGLPGWLFHHGLRVRGRPNPVHKHVSSLCLNRICFVLLTKARPTAKCRVRVGVDYTGPGFWEAWLPGSRYLTIDHNSLSIW